MTPGVGGLLSDQAWSDSSRRLAIALNSSDPDDIQNLLLYSLDSPCAEGPFSTPLDTHVLLLPRWSSDGLRIGYSSSFGQVIVYGAPIGERATEVARYTMTPRPELIMTVSIAEEHGFILVLTPMRETALVAVSPDGRTEIDRVTFGDVPAGVGVGHYAWGAGSAASDRVALSGTRDGDFVDDPGRIDIFDYDDAGFHWEQSILGEEIPGISEMGAEVDWQPDGSALAVLAADSGRRPTLEVLVFRFDEERRWRVLRSAQYGEQYASRRGMEIRDDGRQVVLVSCAPSDTNDCTVRLFDVTETELVEAWAEHPTFEGARLCPYSAVFAGEGLAGEGRLAVLASRTCDFAEDNELFLFVYE